MNDIITQFYQVCGAILSPPFCAHCHIILAERQVLCAECSLLLTPVVSRQLPLASWCSLSVYAVSGYHDPLRRLIVAKNYGHRVASTQLASLIWQYTILSTIPADIIVPIPLHWSRYAWRGFNQSDVMAHALARFKKVPVLPLVRRRKATVFQAELNAKERSENVKHAFEIDLRYAHMRGKHIILVDDLMTTGSTLQEVGKTLLALEPASITAFVAARVV